MEFIETDIFTKRIMEVLTDEEYSCLQADLIEDPKAGKLIREGMGLRKLRWSAYGKGKSGGIRVIYCLVSEEKIYMIFAYKKSKQEDLTPSQLKILAQYVKRGVV